MPLQVGASIQTLRNPCGDVPPCGHQASQLKRWNATACCIISPRPCLTHTGATPILSPAPTSHHITGAASTAKEICAALIIGIILIQVPQVITPACYSHAPFLFLLKWGSKLSQMPMDDAQSDAASELLAKGQFGSMKQSANFISITTWVLIAAFIGLSAIASAN